MLATIWDCTNEAAALSARTGIEILNHNALALERVDGHYDPEIQDLLNDTRKFDA